MKVLYVSDWISTGGTPKALFNLLTEMKNYNVEVVVCVGARREIIEKLKSMGVKYVVSSHPYAVEKKVSSVFKFKNYLMYKLRTIYAMARINSEVDINSIDLIHTNLARSDLGAYLSKKYNIPHVVHLREDLLGGYECYFVNKNYINFMNDNTDKFIAVSNSVKKNWVSCGIDENKIDVIYDGIPITNFHRVERNDGIIRFIICGHVNELKGQIDAIRAVKRLVYKGIKNIILYIVGWYDQVYYDRLVSYIRKHHISEYICFMKKVEDVYPILSKMDVGLMCSRSEGFGLVTIEYMMEELGVIVSDIDVNKEIVSDSENGLYYEKGNIESLVTQMEKYINDKSLINQMGVAARKKVTSSFACSDNASKIYSLYKEIV